MLQSHLKISDAKSEVLEMTEMTAPYDEQGQNNLNSSVSSSFLLTDIQTFRVFLLLR